MTILQQRNDQLVDLLSPEFWGRNEPNVAWRHACSAFQAIPGLRGFWPMSSFDENGDAFDLSEQDRTLSYNGNPTYNFDQLAPVIDFDGTGDFLDRADEPGLDVLGTELYVAAAIRGLTIGGWFSFDTATTNEGLIGKWGAAGVGTAGYMLQKLATDDVRFILSNTGADSFISGLVDVDVTGGWNFIIGRFIPSTEVLVYVNGVTNSLVAGVPASIFNNAIAFEISGLNNGTVQLMDGRASMCFLSTAALSDAIIGALFEQTRTMFGV